MTGPGRDLSEEVSPLGAGGWPKYNFGNELIIFKIDISFSRSKNNVKQLNLT